MPALRSLVVTTPATVELAEGVSVTLQFDRNKTNSYWHDAVQSGIREQNNFAIADALASVAISWDLYNEVEGDYPPTRENFASLSLGAQSELFAAIVDAATPGRAEGNASANTSATAAQVYTNAPASPQNGPEPSPSPEFSASL
jgi:hypothetical protein